MQLRSVLAADALGLLALDRALVADGRGVVLLPEDLPTDRAGAEERLAPWLGVARSDALRLVQVDGDGAIVGEGSIRRLSPSLLRHVALLALGVHPAHQGRGLGRQMMGALLAWARAPGGEPVRRVELYVRADNTRAIGLYLSFGFVVEGTRRDFVRLPDGACVDDLVMGLLLP